MTGNLLASTLEDMALVLINNVPAGNLSEKVLLSYLQLLYETTLALTNISEKLANRILSPLFAVLIEMLLTGNKVGKFAANQFNFIISNCLRPSLWRKGGD